MIITISPRGIERCEKHGRLVVAILKRGDDPASNAVSGNRGADRDPALQARAKMAEVAVCKMLGIDPETNLNWSGHPDDGKDLIHFGCHIDVKSTKHPHGRYLIWTNDVNHLFEKKKFDVLFFVRGMPPAFDVCRWTTKGIFRERHRVAPAGHLLERGTWFMPMGELFMAECFGPGWATYSGGK